jgi:hypothetical protein
MAEAATAVAEPVATEPAAPPPAAEAPKSKEDRINAAIAKGKAVAAAKTGEAPKEEPKEPAAEATDGDEAPAKLGETEEETVATDPAKPAEEPKTARAKEWATINKQKAEIAKREREAKRIYEENLKTRADLQVIQQQLSELNKLRRESPKKFIDAIAADSGGMRRLFEEALQEEKRTPEQEKELARDRELEELKAWKREQEEKLAEWKRLEEARQAQQQTQQWHEENYKRTQDAIAQLVTEGGYPNVRKAIDVGDGRFSAKRLAYVAGDIYNRIFTEWERTGGHNGGHERPIPEVLDLVEEELAKDAGSASPAEAPSARATGAEPTAKPEAKPKRTPPPTLTNAHAAARASGGRELRGEDRKRFFATRLGKVPQQ